MARWVQSRYSTDAKKWEVEQEFGDYFAVFTVWNGLKVTRALPKEEYVITDSPERWETCTRDEVDIYCCDGGVLEYQRGSRSICVDTGYRWAWSEKDPDALVIQRKVK